jgi:hypothetical protein
MLRNLLTLACLLFAIAAYRRADVAVRILTNVDVLLITEGDAVPMYPEKGPAVRTAQWSQAVQPGGHSTERECVVWPPHADGSMDAVPCFQSPREQIDCGLDVVCAANNELVRVHEAWAKLRMLTAPNTISAREAKRWDAVRAAFKRLDRARKGTV